MTTDKKEKAANSTKARRKPLQARAQKRHDQILDITAELLDRVGIDDLTTILIAKELKISVGSLYHYYPNKVAILCALTQRWLDEMTSVVTTIDADLEKYDTIRDYIKIYTHQMVKLYKRQRGVMPLVQAMYAIPEVRTLDQQHDVVLINSLCGVFKHFGCKASGDELLRIADLFHEVTYISSMSIVDLKGNKASNSEADLNIMLNALLASYLD